MKPSEKLKGKKSNFKKEMKFIENSQSFMI